MEAARAVLALLALLAIAVVRRPAVALAFAAAALVAGGWTGHSVAVATAFTGPARALHLLGVAVWLGGLLWLFLMLGSEWSRAAAARVSSLALAAVLVVAISGLVQLGFFLPEPYAHLDSAYGAVSLAKIVGLGGLVAFGAYHRKRVLPRLAGAGVESGFRRSLRPEIALMAVVVLVTLRSAPDLAPPLPPSRPDA